MKLQFRTVEGRPQTEENIEKAIQEGIKFLEQSKNNPYVHNYASSSGSTFVIIFKCHEYDGGGYEIIVTDAYRQAYHENTIFNN